MRPREKTVVHYYEEQKLPDQLQQSEQAYRPKSKGRNVLRLVHHDWLNAAEELDLGDQFCHHIGALKLRIALVGVFVQQGWLPDIWTWSCVYWQPEHQ